MESAETDVQLRRRAVVAVIIALAVAVIAVFVGVWVAGSALVNSDELAFLVWLNAGQSGLGDALALAINYGLGPLGAVVVIVAATACISLIRHSWRGGGVFVVLAVVPWLVVQSVKMIVARPRPDMHTLANILVNEPNSTSYPSGHTAFALSIGLALAVTIVRIRPRARVLVFVLAIALGLVAAWSRMYLGVHHPTDVAASFAIVLTSSWATAAVQDFMHERSAEKGGAIRR